MNFSILIIFVNIMLSSLDFWLTESVYTMCVITVWISYLKMLVYKIVPSITNHDAKPLGQAFQLISLFKFDRPIVSTSIQKSSMVWKNEGNTFFRNNAAI